MGIPPYGISHPVDVLDYDYTPLPPQLMRGFVFQNGQTALMMAAEQGNLEMVQELIDKRANCNLDDVVSVPRGRISGGLL